MKRFPRLPTATAVFLVLVAVVGTEAYPHPVLPQDPNTTQHQQFASVVNPHYGLHVFATGTNGSLYHMWQTSDPSEGGFANSTSLSVPTLSLSVRSFDHSLTPSIATH